MIFVIAELGINHNGNIETAKQLIKVAKDCGCNAVKFQKRTIDIVYTKEFLDSPRESPWGKTQRDQKQGLEFGLEQYHEIDRYCKELQIDWFASAWDIPSKHFLRQFDLKYNKIASAMLVYEELLQEVAFEGKYTFISTGMSNIGQIAHAIKIFSYYICPFELMHCVSTYPMADEDANLNKILELKDKFNCNVGYSGHEVGVAISCAAAGLGITSLERHITLDRTSYGSDQSASLEPNGLRQLVDSVRKIEKAMGTGSMEINPKEIPIAKKLRGYIK